MTSIEWLVDRIDISNPFMVSELDIEKAKEMHKQEIIDAVSYGNYHYKNYEEAEVTGENYYQETFKKY